MSVETDLDRQIKSALGQVYDPCSIAAGRPISLVDMGLVTEWAFADGALSITFCVTFAGCTMAPHFVEAARVELSKIKGVREVITQVDTDYIWTPPALAPMHGRPQAWREYRKT